SHSIDVAAPEGITFAIEGNTVTVSGSDKQLVGETAANICKLHITAPHQAMGIRYEGETIRRKAGKAGKYCQLSVSKAKAKTLPVVAVICAYANGSSVPQYAHVW